MTSVQIKLFQLLASEQIAKVKVNSDLTWKFVLALVIDIQNPQITQAITQQRLFIAEKLIKIPSTATNGEAVQTIKFACMTGET